VWKRGVEVWGWSVVGGVRKAGSRGPGANQGEDEERWVAWTGDGAFVAVATASERLLPASIAFSDVSHPVDIYNFCAVRSLPLPSG
jgi:hypothetical protein